ncbi:ABC transporter ATP-binding protein [soil metagenome]
MKLLSIRHGPVRRGRRKVLEGGSISAPTPAAIAVVGINGSGKSSLFLHLSGMLLGQQSDPLVSVAGERATIAVVPQEPALPGWLRVEEVAVLFGTDFAVLTREMPALHLAELANKRAGALSAGQRQVLAIALALSRQAALTLLDEPFSALDFRRRIGVLELLRARLDTGLGSIMLSSQSAADLAELCQNFVVIRNGRYAFNGTRDELVHSAEVSSLEDGLLRLLT